MKLFSLVALKVLTEPLFYLHSLLVSVFIELSPVKAQWCDEHTAAFSSPALMK